MEQMTVDRSQVRFVGDIHFPVITNAYGQWLMRLARGSRVLFGIAQIEGGGWQAGLPHKLWEQRRGLVTIWEIQYDIGEFFRG